MNTLLIVLAIWHIEGGAATRYPYGVKSVKVTTAAEAREVCIRTVDNNKQRWERAGKPGCFLDFLGDRYCPAKYDKRGNANWKRNIKRRLNHNTCDCRTE